LKITGGTKRKLPQTAGNRKSAAFSLDFGVKL
jgi:hypothetical protein